MEQSIFFCLISIVHMHETIEVRNVPLDIVNKYIVRSNCPVNSPNLLEKAEKYFSFWRTILGD
ncbi:hypothetical protein AY599_12670 [Leptolyngbya valderiana BDU 20041]|nr:hypothetical protein AY599_12670 [Leptolyngbya valderiana BDU 20041]